MHRSYSVLYAEIALHLLQSTGSLSYLPWHPCSHILSSSVELMLP